MDNKEESSGDLNLPANIRSARINEEPNILLFLAEFRRTRASVEIGLKYLRNLWESEVEIMTAKCLEPRTLSESGMTNPDPDGTYYRARNAAASEHGEIRREFLRTRDRLVRENHRLLTVESAVFALPEPHRSVIIFRYLEALPWEEVQTRMGSSPTRVFRIHKEGLGLLMSRSEMNPCQVPP